MNGRKGRNPFIHFVFIPCRLISISLSIYLPIHSCSTVACIHREREKESDLIRDHTHKGGRCIL